MFVRAANPIWYMVDHVGQPLNDEYYAFFLTNTLPYVPQNVYRDPQGMTVWTGDVVQFSPAGTLPDNLYFDPNLVYRIEIRHGNSQTDELIWEINNFVPGSGNNNNNSLSILGNENQITNPEFSLIDFVSPDTITVAGTYLIAPGWELVLVGVGATTTISQNILSGNQNIVNNPPFSLRINNNGWTQAFLRQRFNHNGALWAAGAITMSVTARAQTTTQEISLIYAPSAPGVSQVVVSGFLGTGAYQVLQGAINLPPSVNTGLSPVAYVDMIIQLPPTGIVDITCVQLIGQSNPLPSDFDPLTDIPFYQQETEEREIDHTFHVYSDQLITRPKDNILVGWIFGLNPYQFNLTSLQVNVPLTSYIADQTILHQETASALKSGRAGLDQNFGLVIQAINGVTNNRFAIIQYVDPSAAAPYWGYILSSLARVRIFTSHNTQVRLKARLIYRSDLPPTLGNAEPIVSWDSNGNITFSAGWTALSPLNDPPYILPNLYDVTDGVSAFPALSYDQFSLLTADISKPNSMFALVLYTMDDINQTLGAEDVIIFDKVSLTPNLFAVEANPQTFDEVLSSCQFYYEKSYNLSDLAGAVTVNGARYAVNPLSTEVSSGNLDFYKNTFQVVYKQIKRSLPLVTFYSPASATINQVQGGVYNGTGYPQGGFVPNPRDLPINGWAAVGASVSSIRMRPADATAVISVGATDQGSNQGELIYHYVADSRLGV